jgi:hypothetical protein
MRFHICSWRVPVQLWRCSGQAMDATAGVRFPREQYILLFFRASWPALKPSKFPTQWLRESVHAGLKREVVKLTIRLYLVPSLRNMQIWLHFPTCLHVTVHNYTSKYTDNFTFHVRGGPGIRHLHCLIVPLALTFNFGIYVFNYSYLLIS